MNRTMKKNKGLFVGILLGVITLVAFGSTFFIFKNNNQNQGDEEMTVVTSFYPMYVATANIVDGMEHVHLENLSEPETGCLHDYQLTPDDMQLLSTADVFVVNGGGIEEFLSDVAGAYPNLVIIESSEGIVGDDDNPHAWMSVTAYEKQVQKIAEGIAGVDEAHADDYIKNASEYSSQLKILAAEIDDLKVATQGQPVILFHEAMEYFAEDLGMSVVYTMDLDEERQVSAKEVAEVMSVIREQSVSSVLADETYGKELGDMVAQSTMARTIYLNPMVRGAYDRDSYLTYMEENIQAIRDNFVAR